MTAPAKQRSIAQELYEGGFQAGLEEGRARGFWGAFWWGFITNAVLLTAIKIAVSGLP